jgi:Bacterial TSP3 repeat
MRRCKVKNQSKILIFYLGFVFMFTGVVSAAQIWEQPYDIENDPDIDHLTTSEELELGTDPNNRDTDGDGLSDGNEFLAKTNPLVKDTDGDSFDDTEDN